MTKRLTALSAAQLANIDTRRLPPQLRRLTDILGMTETWQFVRLHGGLQVDIPKHITPALVQRFGAHVAELLVKHFAQMRLDIPKSDKLMLQVRNAEIVRQLDDASYGEVAQRFGLTRRQIININQANAPATPTLKLF